MTLSRASVPEALIADTPTTSTPSSMTLATAARTLMLDNCAMITASKPSLDIEVLFSAYWGTEECHERLHLVSTAMAYCCTFLDVRNTLYCVC